MRVVEEADAAALVCDVMMLLAARGHDVRVPHVNSVRLVRLGALMLAEFGIGTGAGRLAEEGDG